jgi:hypothetical protein
MKKLIAIFAALVMVCTVVPVLADNEYHGGHLYDNHNKAWLPDGSQNPVTTYATIAGSGGGEGGSQNPIIKVKWEYDMDTEFHDADLCDAHLQVAPIIGQTVTVGYFAVVTSPNGIDPNPANLGYVYTYCDIWHPDGQFKYQIELYPVGWDGQSYDKTVALDAWDLVTDCHQDLIMTNDDWASSLPPGTEPYCDVHDELNEELALLYYGEAELSYCQPGGTYYVGATAFDKLGNQADYVYNSFWYIPTSAVEIDFNTVDYSPVHIGTHKVVGGDCDMLTPNKPTVRNIGNTPVILGVKQDDMGFGETSGEWNVQFDARMTANGEYVYYSPYEEATIPGILPLCTKEKLDFSILATKGVSGITYSGWMKIYACIYFTTSPYTTPCWFIGDAPVPVPQVYDGPADPWNPI